MKQALFIVVPSRMEGFGFVTAEAMFNNCLVIGRNVAGTKEQFDNGMNMSSHEIGLRFSTPSELVSQMLFALSHDTSVMRRNAYDTVAQLYTKEFQCSEIESYYYEIMRQNLK